MSTDSFLLQPCGPRAVLLRFASREDETSFAVGRRWWRAVQAKPPPGLVEAVPAFTSLMLEFTMPSRLSLRELQTWLEDAWAAAGPSPAEEGRQVEIPVFYDGPDLARVAACHGLDASEVVRLHTAGIYRVHMLGFAPGFAYLGGLAERLHTPRLDTPRSRVPAGSVAIGGSHTAVYPLETPGGWNLIGRTDLRLFDPDKDGEQAFLLRPGDWVRFVERKAEA